MIWFVLGMLVSAVNMRSIKRFVLRLRPGSNLKQRTVLISYLLRYALNAAVLLIAVQFGIRSVLATFAGLWVYRWFFLFNQRLLHRPRGQNKFYLV